eukprot:4635016-Pyramimonas_sp.AAC.1
MAEHAVHAAENDGVFAARQKLNHAWAVFLQDAEMELAQVLDFPQKSGTRDRYLARRWVPALGRKFRAADDVAVCRGWQWLY